jgi:hypothetical protein
VSTVADIIEEAPVPGGDVVRITDMLGEEILVVEPR